MLQVPLPLVLLALALLSPASSAADWSRWLGPGQDSRGSGAGLAPGQGVGFEVAWKRPLGIGYTGIAVTGDRAVTMFADGTKDWVVATDAKTGKELWRYEIDAMYPAMGGSEGGPNSMPVVADGVVYGLGAKGHLFALSLADGKELWKVRIDETLGGRAPGFGFSTVPLVAGDVLFVQAGGEKGKSLAGFDRRTGKLLWSHADERAGYASPILANLGGVEQIVALTNRAVYGIDPKAGKVLWSREYATTDEHDAGGTPVLIGADRFFVNGDQESKAYSVARDGAAWKVEELYTTRALKGSFATPVFHEGHLYGFDGDFLTCIKAEDGTKVWKSRPPGGRGMILVDGQLLIWANDGSLVAVEASPAGYKETGRMSVADAGTWTYPSYADGRLFLRNTKELAAVSLRPAAAAAATTAGTGAPRNDFERFLQRVEKASAKRLLVDDFMAAQKSFPIVEDGWVHFVYRGRAEDVAVSGSMTDFQVEEALKRVQGTDLFYRSYEAGPATRWEYRLNVDFENRQPDPLNPRRVPARDGDVSEVTTSGWKRSEWRSAYAGTSPGRIETVPIKSTVLSNDRNVEVYLPAGYDSGSERHPLVVVVDGGNWRDLGQLPNVLDHLTGTRLAPAIVAFVRQPPNSGQEIGGPRIDDYVKLLAEEVVPKLDATFRTLARADARATLGAGSGGTAAVYAAVQRPDVFGKAAATSMFLSGVPLQKLNAAIEGATASSAKPALRVTWCEKDLRRADWNADIARDSRALVETLRNKGFTVEATEVSDSAGWGGWPVRAGEMLTALFPRG